MHIHILGICGTFMGGIASLAVAKGYRVTGSDHQVYPPMSKQLAALGITLQEGYDPAHLDPRPDCVVIGNALSRGNPAVEYVLNQGIPYQSGPQWLAENLLKDRWVIAVAGTHGKTTTTSMIAWILEYAGFDPGFLVGGIPANFGISAKWGKGPYFVVEADEYDSAFFDKRSKFVHYHPKTCVLNNLEFDHADIFKDLAEIQKQFHHLVRTVPGEGALIVPQADQALQAVLAQGCWTPVQSTGLNQGEWQAHLLEAAGGTFEIRHQGILLGAVNWGLIGDHNVHNGLCAVAAAVHAGVAPGVALQALSCFKSVKRRMEVCGQARGITIYDDFAHHPTAILSTLLGLRAKLGEGKRVIAVLDIRSNTMCMGTHKDELAAALTHADGVYVYQSPKTTWDVATVLGPQAHVYADTQALIDALGVDLVAHDHVLIMSNGGFDNIHERLLAHLSEKVCVV